MGDINLLNLFHGSQILDKDGKEVTIASLNGKMVGIYFSAHWCPPCRNFTPQLAQRYNEFISAGHPFEIIFVSSDRALNEYNEYYKTMPWKALEFKAKHIKEKLEAEFSLNSIPTLVLVNGNGKLLTTNGRNIILTTAFQDLLAYTPETKASGCVIS